MLQQCVPQPLQKRRPACMCQGTVPQYGKSASLLAFVTLLWLGKLAQLRMYYPCPGMHLSWGQLSQP